MFTQTHVGFSRPDFSYASYPFHPGYVTVERTIDVRAEVVGLQAGGLVVARTRHAVTRRTIPLGESSRYHDNSACSFCVDGAGCLNLSAVVKHPSGANSRRLRPGVGRGGLAGHRYRSDSSRLAISAQCGSILRSISHKQKSQTRSNT